MINSIIESFNIDKDVLLKALFETLEMLGVALIFTFIFGLIIGIILFITRYKGLYENKVLYLITSTIVNIIRSVPCILFIIILIPLTRVIVGTGFGVNASKFPLSIVGIATFSRLVEQALLSVNKDIYETSYALGANTFQYFKSFLLRESRQFLVLSFVSTTISLISYSTVVGVIAGGGLGYLAINEGYQNFNYPLMWIIIIIMIIIVQAVQGLGNLVAKKIDKR